MHPIATLFVTFFINPVGYEAFPRRNGFVGIPCFNTGCLVKHICLSHAWKVTISFLYLFNPGFSRLHFNRIRLFLLQLRLACAHALLGDQQDDRGDDQNGAEDVEDGGAHAAGGGKEAPAWFSTLAVTERSASVVPPFTSTLYGSSSRL